MFPLNIGQAGEWQDGKVEMMPTQTTARSNKQLVDELRRAPDPWIDSAIVVAFEDRFEFVGEDHLDPMSRLNSLEAQGGLAIGLAGMRPGARRDQRTLSARVFSEYVGQGWAHRYMDILLRMARNAEIRK
jgi:hypothetical protein